VVGTPDPVSSAAEIHAFAAEHGLPVAIKAAFGGGGRGLKVAFTVAEIDEQYDSAVREAIAAFGRGECFVERYLNRPRHVETQCLADEFGTVVVVSTRDCSLQRRHQKLVEEAPAPFLTDEQNRQLTTSSIAILREVGYVGAGTCEFLVGEDGTVSFLEVNTRLQVEHPVTEEVSGIDLVREQLRIATGEPLGYDHVTTRGHSFEFRINGEDASAGFLPAPGRITTLNLPAGPGVRVDSGVVEGDTVSGAFDSMIAKLVVTGASRTQAAERARRALAELEVVGIPTVVPFHRAVIEHEDFVPRDPRQPFAVHTRWIETEFADSLPGLAVKAPASLVQREDPEPAAMERVVVEVGGKRLEVVIPAGLSWGAGRGAGARRPVRRTTTRTSSANGTGLMSPMQGTIVKVAVVEGALVAEGDLVVVLEAMKMEQPLVAHRPGTITRLAAGVGANVSAGSTICEIVD
jgi:acetyl-CoA/propionyl-CoA carboxylase biotin carboxyl carrier protein